MIHRKSKMLHRQSPIISWSIIYNDFVIKVGWRFVDSVLGNLEDHEVRWELSDVGKDNKFDSFKRRTLTIDTQTPCFWFYSAKRNTRQPLIDTLSIHPGGLPWALQCTIFLARGYLPSSSDETFQLPQAHYYAPVTWWGNAQHSRQPHSSLGIFPKHDWRWRLWFGWLPVSQWCQ